MAVDCIIDLNALPLPVALCHVTLQFFPLKEKNKSHLLALGCHFLIELDITSYEPAISCLSIYP